MRELSDRARQRLETGAPVEKTVPQAQPVPAPQEPPTGVSP